MPKDKLEVLLIEDNLSEADLVREMLSTARRLQCSVVHVQRLSQGLQLLMERAFDVILVDLGLPDSQGLETALAVRSHATLIPIIVITVLDDEDIAIKSLQMDVQDYLVKGEITGPVLSRAIRYAIQRKRDSESLRKSEEALRVITDTMPVGVTRCSRDHRYLWVNPEYARWLKRLPEEIIGRPIVEIIGEAAYQAILPHVERVLSGQRVVEYEANINFKGPGTVWIRALYVPVFDSAGVADGWVAVVTDITKHKRAEQEILRLNDELKAQAAVLEHANQDLNAFNRTVAHDLRQPLNLISGYCQAIKMMCGDQIQDECIEYFEETHATVLRMNNLIGTLLHFSRLANLEPHREIIELSSMAHEVAEELKQTQPERQVDFRIADGITANADVNLLRVVLDNLIGNAWKYTGTRDDAVIEFGRAEIDGKLVYFIRDNGIGFDQAKAGKLFTPFERLKGAEEFRGFGIGLSTVERIIQRHGGKVWAAGEPDKGATFYFTIPSDP